MNVLFDPVDSADLVSFRIVKNNTINLWNYDLRCPKLYGSSTIETTIVPVTLYATLASNDTLNFVYSTSSGLPIVKSGTTLNITSLSVGATKSFVIQNPLRENKYLQHGCLEGLDSAVYYRGEGTIIDGEMTTTIELPDFVKNLAYRFTIQITPIYDGKVVKTFNTSRVKDNKFIVYGDAGEFFWLVHGTRHEFEIEPLKTSVVVKGNDTPYTWI